MAQKNSITEKLASAKIARIIKTRARDLGGFKVHRLLPTSSCKMIGPFIFFDHMGPAVFQPEQGLDVRPHPHIGLATVTFLFEGAILHRDSLGFQQEIHPGDVNWMTAGSGIVHSERTPPRLRQKGSHLEGIQCWVALPKAHEESAPSFHHHPASTLPRFELSGVHLRLLLGSAYGHTSPVQIFSDVLYIDVTMGAATTLQVPAGDRELGVYLVCGQVRLEGSPLTAKSLAVGQPGEDLTIEADLGSRLMIIGGQAFPESREIWWNFVASSPERIERAKIDWAAGRFPLVPGDEHEFIPLPDAKSGPQKPPGTIL